MSRTAFVCPGQGAQHVGMGTDLAAEFATVKHTFEEADDALDAPLSRLMRDGPEDELTRTANAQPALLTMAVAIARTLEAEGAASPVIAAGHSLGEWSALVIAGALDFAEALRAVRERGRLMQEAVPEGRGAMSALFGTDAEGALELCREASAALAGATVVPANLNGAGQIVVAGDRGAVERLEELAAGRKLRAVRLKVSAPFHSPLMAPAREAMRPVLAALTVRDPDVPVVSNVEGLANSRGDRVRDLLSAQITSPVKWEDCARAVGRAAQCAIEVGPGRVLTGLMRRIVPGFPCAPTGDVAGVRSAIAQGAG
jgi:[acyl-carrier-protein] S-malonyltransferase